MKTEEIQALFESYEAAVCVIDNTECWSARDLQKLFGYSLWQNFTKVIAKAKEACSNVGQDVLDHFIDVNKMVELGSGAKREVDDVMQTYPSLKIEYYNSDTGCELAETETLINRLEAYLGNNIKTTA